jgi:hypothetical protein
MFSNVSFAADVITEYCFGASNHRVEDENFGPSFSSRGLGSGEITILLKHYPIIGTIFSNIPEFIALRSENMAKGYKVKKVFALP